VNGICKFDIVALQAVKAFFTFTFDALTFDDVIVIIVALLEVFENVAILLKVPTRANKFDVYDTFATFDVVVMMFVNRVLLENALI